ncbi:C4-dicarboxylate transporter DctM subunit [Lysinibacillus composti]|uniref:TRAP transporter large permease n=1 Tax=Lysinibacillus composti TaxID=720633 RepID=A0A3N9UCZ0_9BACI|nr:TRAP transporter large permease [Lysinibacillus composti]MBM7609324.1 C4-dicarboxylate transporter DctM subunit [Lysinibacillus composti]RQW74269.1 TRAP transporter large permease [Lysinibacillus composti]
MSILLFVLLCILFFLNVPIAVALGLSTIIIVLLTGSFELSTVPHRMFTTLDSFPLMAAPFFILAGKIMEHGGISDKIVEFASSLVGHLRGGLAHVSIVACMFFAALSGSAVATTAAVGGLLIPAMVKAGYNREFSASVQAAGGTTGVIIPPSVPMVLFAVSAGVSVSDLFIAGVVPGIFIGITLMVWVYIYSLKNEIRSTETFNLSKVWKSGLGSILALLMPIIILGGIYGGFFTPTEASVIAVVYGFLVGKFVYKKITWNVLRTIILETVIVLSTLSVIIASASIFGFYLTIERLPHELASVISELNLQPVVVMFVIIIFLLIVGMFIDEISAIIILTPILLPIATSIGIDPVHFGIIMIVNLTIGLLTPPVGLSLFVASKVGNVLPEKMIKPLMPFIIIMTIDVVILWLFPQLSVGVVKFFS